MPRGLRSKIALVVLLGAFLIPIGTSSLRGLTHVLTCSDPEEVPFTLVNPEGGPPVIASSATLTRGADRGVCGGLVLDVGAQPGRHDRVNVQLTIANATAEDWQGTVKLKVGDTTVPVGIGRIKARATAVDTVEVRVKPGSTDVQGSLLVGP
jgi:hypothetical protein